MYREIISCDIFFFCFLFIYLFYSSSSSFHVSDVCLNVWFTDTNLWSCALHRYRPRARDSASCTEISQCVLLSGNPDFLLVDIAGKSKFSLFRFYFAERSTVFTTWCMSPRINLVIRSIMRAHSAGRRKSKMARRTTNRKHQGNVLKQAWEWTDHTEPEKITSENIESVYLVNTTVCSQGDCRWVDCLFYRRSIMLTFEINFKNRF